MNFPAVRRVLAASCLLTLSASGFAVSCKTQAALSDAERSAIVEAARRIAGDVQSGRSDDLKSATIPAVAANFSAIQQSAAALTPLMGGATLTVDAIYRLDAADAKPGEDQTQFFCDAADNSSHATFSIQHLPPGQFAFSVIRATGNAKPQQLALLLQMESSAGPWQLAGFFPKPLTVAGHDGLWYWRQARAYAQKKQPWNAWLYYSTATYLLQPAGFISTTNLEKLVDEQAAAKPAGLPAETPLILSANGAETRITSLRTDDALGGLDVVVHYEVADHNDPVAARARTVQAMKALLVQHPELRDAFHGVWAFADTPTGPPFSLELPMPALTDN
jgi:hypothetical protein